MATNVLLNALNNDSMNAHVIGILSPDRQYYGECFIAVASKLEPMMIITGSFGISRPRDKILWKALYCRIKVWQALSFKEDYYIPLYIRICFKPNN